MATTKDSKCWRGCGETECYSLFPDVPPKPHVLLSKASGRWLVLRVWYWVKNEVIGQVHGDWFIMVLSLGDGWWQGPLWVWVVCILHEIKEKGRLAAVGFCVPCHELFLLGHALCYAALSWSQPIMDWNFCKLGAKNKPFSLACGCWVYTSTQQKKKAYIGLMRRCLLYHKYPCGLRKVT